MSAEGPGRPCDARRCPGGEHHSRGRLYLALLLVATQRLLFLVCTCCCASLAELQLATSACMPCMRALAAALWRMPAPRTVIIRARRQLTRGRRGATSTQRRLFGRRGRMPHARLTGWRCVHATGSCGAGVCITCCVSAQPVHVSCVHAQVSGMGSGRDALTGEFAAVMAAELRATSCDRQQRVGADVQP